MSHVFHAITHAVYHAFHETEHAVSHVAYEVVKEVEHRPLLLAAPAIAVATGGLGTAGLLGGIGSAVESVASSPITKAVSEIGTVAGLVSKPKTPNININIPQPKPQPQIRQPKPSLLGIGGMSLFKPMITNIHKDSSIKTFGLGDLSSLLNEG